MIRPHFKLLVEHLLVLVLNEAFVGLVVFLDDLQCFRLQRSLKELFETLIIHLVLLDIDSQVPIDDVQEDFLKLVELFHINESALLSKELVGVEDIRVELLGNQSRSKYQSIQKKDSINFYL